MCHDFGQPRDREVDVYGAGYILHIDVDQTVVEQGHDPVDQHDDKQDQLLTLE